MNKGVAPILGMADLACLYKERLKWLRLSVPEGRIYTRSKLLFVSVIPDLVTYTGQNIVLTFDNVIEHALGQVGLCDHDSHAVHLAKAADIDKKEEIWKNVVAPEQNSFHLAYHSGMTVSNKLSPNPCRHPLTWFWQEQISNTISSSCMCHYYWCQNRVKSSITTPQRLVILSRMDGGNQA